MDLAFSAEQTLLQDSIDRFIQNDYAFESRQQIVQEALGYSTENWRTFAELGWLGVSFAEADGGFGGSAVETMIVMEGFGKGLVVEPYLATVVLAGGVLKIAGSQAQKQQYLAGVIDGSRQAALAYAEPQGRFNLADLVTRGEPDGSGGWVLNGHKSVVLNGPAAEFLIVSVRTSGAQRDAQGISLFVVPANAQGVSRRDYPTVDAFRASEITLENVSVAASSLLGTQGQGLAIIEQVIDEAIVAVGSEAVGCMEVLYKATVEYCKTRQQFGQPIGKFQVLQHAIVDMFMEHEQSKSLMFMAAMQMADGYGDAAKKGGVRIQSPDW